MPARRLAGRWASHDGGTAPPDPERAWTAELAWYDAPPRFAAVAEGRHVLASSAELPWPPAGERDVQALHDAVAVLERRLLADGWQPAGAGEHWYARRYTWPAATPARRRGTRRRVPEAEARHGAPGRPVPQAAATEGEVRAGAPGRPVPQTAEAEAEQAVPARAAGAQPAEAPAGVPAQARAEAEPWPAGAEERWRCQIAWHVRLLSARFSADAYAPGDDRRRPVAASASFRHLRTGEATEEEAAWLQELVGALAARLEAEGWQPAGRGPDWYARRFVWPGEGHPRVLGEG